MRHRSPQNLGSALGVRSLSVATAFGQPLAAAVRSPSRTLCIPASGKGRCSSAKGGVPLLSISGVWAASWVLIGLRLYLEQEDQGKLNFYTEEFLYLQFAKKPKLHHMNVTLKLGPLSRQWLAKFDGVGR